MLIEFLSMVMGRVMGVMNRINVKVMCQYHISGQDPAPSCESSQSATPAGTGYDGAVPGAG